MRIIFLKIFIFTYILERYYLKFKPLKKYLKKNLICNKIVYVNYIFKINFLMLLAPSMAIFTPLNSNNKIHPHSIQIHKIDQN